MKVLCKETTSKNFDLTFVTTVFSNQFDYNFGGYGIELNKEYFVMGIALYKDSNCLYYLIDVYGKPNWFPCLLFNILDNKFPNEWFINKNFIIENDLEALWGFRELCNIDSFNTDLLDRKVEEMNIYFERKYEFYH